MKNTFLAISFACLLISFSAGQTFAHCEIPCGIYDDEMRIQMIIEHIATIEKSMKQILKLEQEKRHHTNQLVRWIMNKERHANQLQEIVTQYFLTQRIKLDTKDYAKKLGLLHHMLVYAMKSKQTTDLNMVAELKRLVQDFQALYFGKK
jgi:nickel superoxide dismutase